MALSNSPSRSPFSCLALALRQVLDLLPRGAGLSESVWRHRHRWVLIVLGLHTFGLPGFGLLAGAPASHLISAGVLVAGLAWLAAESTFSQQIRTTLATVGLVLSSMILVYFSGGNIEAHFHFFVLIPFVALYQEWHQFLIYFLLVIGHHAVLGSFAPTTVFSHSEAMAHPVWWTFIHGSGIMAESIGLFFYWRVQEMERDNLARVEERLRLATEAAQIGTWDWDIGKNRLYWDDRMLQLFGVTKHSFTGPNESWRDTVVSEDLVRIEEELQAALRNEKPFNSEFRICKSDGSIRHLKTRGLIIFGTGGAPLRAIGVNYDITEQKQTESALLERETYLRAVMDHAMTGIITIDEQGVIETFNPSAEHLFGYTADEAVGQNVKILMPEPYHSEHGEYLDRYRRTGKPRIIGIGREVLGRRKDGTEFPLDLAVSEVFLSNRRIFIGMIRDITQIKDNEARLEEAAVELECRNAELEIVHKQVLDATRAKSAFLAAMSHEIRTPMNSIIGMAELLSETSLSMEQQDYVQRFRRASTHLLELINDILDLSKIEAGHMQLESIPFQLHDLVEKVGEMMMVRADAKQLELIVHVHPGVPENVVGDPTRLRQILVNLVSNAVKFTERGEILIQVETAQPDVLRFSVSDTGIGIPEDKTALIFDSFTQADSTITRKFGGTGLGLSICKSLVQMMEGEITVTSVLDKGSTFHFTARLPVAVESEGGCPPAAASAIRGRRVLVIDDNRMARLVIREILSKAGVEVLEENDGPAALARLLETYAGSSPVQAILVDHRMPSMSGIDVLTAIRRQPEATAIPVFLLTSELRPSDRARARELGVRGFVNKPIGRESLLRTLAAAFAQPELDRTEKLPPSMELTRQGASPPLDILLVDDLEDNRDVMALFLKHTSYRLDMAENGEVAFQKFQARRYDLVLMDVQMPIMDGLQATAIIRQWEREHDRVPTPVVALTAHALQEEYDKSLAAGCTGHLTKPIKKQELLRAIANHTRPLTDQAA